MRAAPKETPGIFLRKLFSDAAYCNVENCAFTIVFRKSDEAAPVEPSAGAVLPRLAGAVRRGRSIDEDAANGRQVRRTLHPSAELDIG